MSKIELQSSVDAADAESVNGLTPTSASRRSTSAVQSRPPTATHPGHPRTIGWFSASAIAMGGSNQSLFVIGSVLAAQGTAAVPLLVLGLLLSWMAIPGWIELTLMWPDRVGGIAAVCAEAFKPYSAVLANLTGVCYWWGWVPTCAITATLASSALHQWYLPHVPVTTMALVIVAAIAALNLAGLKWAARVARPMAIVAGLLALVSGIAPVLAGHVDWHRALSFHLISPFRGLFGGLTSAMAGLYLIGFAAPAFEAAACHVGEMRAPVSAHPRAMYASAAMATVYFVVLPVVWLGVFGAGPLQGDLSQVLGPTFAPWFGSLAKAAAVWFMVLNMLHGTLQPLSGATRTLLQLSEDGLLPRIFARRMPGTDAPVTAILVTAAAASGVVFIGSPIWIIAAANLTYLIGICLPSVAVWLLRRDEPARERPYRARRGMIEIGVVAAAVWLTSTLLGFEQFGLPTVLCGLAFAYAGSLLYLWRVWTDRRRSGLPRRRGSLHTKLTGAMVAVIAFDGVGYLLAISHVHGDPGLRAGLQDIFVGVALLTISVGLVLPGMIGQSARQLAVAADRLATGTVSDLRRAMQALARGDLAAARARKDETVLGIYSRDELGEMAESFNFMQSEITQTAIALDSARDGLEAMNTTLERQAAEQAALARAEQRGREELQRANHAMGEFLSRVSHELRTPLNAILGFGQLLTATELDAKQRRNTDRILSGGRHLLTLINEILEISRLESGDAGMSLEPVELASVLREALDLVAPSAARRGISLYSDRCDGIWVTADLQRFKQALINLLDNAVKYNRDQGEVRIEVSGDGEQVALSISDQGAGIPQESMDRLFTPFDRLGAERTRIEGTGLGLTLVKQFVEAMGGTIGVQSTHLEGSRFTITVGRAAPGPGVESHSEAMPGAVARCNRRLTVLCIEDNPANLELIESVFEERPDIGLITAVQGRLGLQLCEEHEPDLVILDLHLPDISGTEVLVRLREAPATRELPVVVLSADATAGQIERARAAGATAYLSKPLDVLEFWRTLDDALGAAPAAA